MKKKEIDNEFYLKKMEKNHSIDKYKGWTRLHNFAIPKKEELHLIRIRQNHNGDKYSLSQ